MGPVRSTTLASVTSTCIRFMPLQRLNQNLTKKRNTFHGNTAKCNNASYMKRVFLSRETGLVISSLNEVTKRLKPPCASRSQWKCPWKLYQNQESGQRNGSHNGSRLPRGVEHRDALVQMNGAALKEVTHALVKLWRTLEHAAQIPTVAPSRRTEAALPPGPMPMTLTWVATHGGL